MKPYSSFKSVTVILLLCSLFVYAQQKQTMKMGGASSDAAAAMEKMNERGDTTMGFSHMKTTHHFRLSQKGGTIQVTANDLQDTASIHHIRLHLGHIAAAFSNGDFSMPMRVHSQTPQGVPVMVRRQNDIEYQFRTLYRGGIVMIATNDTAALSAIHEFLRFQIQAHKTGDPVNISE